MSDDPGNDHEAAAPAAPGPLQERLKSIAARLRGAADSVGGELMVDLPSRLGDHEGLLIALANELEQLVK
jgi:hypothetical protein